MTTLTRRSLCCLLACALLSVGRPARAQTDPVPAAGEPAQPGMPQAPQAVQPQLQPGGAAPQPGLPNEPTSAAARRNLDRPTVAIREFRTSVAEIPPHGATDMFVSALVKTRRFRVVERSRLAEGTAAEKALNQQGLSTGQAGLSQYLSATYVFEATISEASSGDRKSTFALGAAGANASQTSLSDSIAIDVRVTDVESGVVVDAVYVRKDLKTVDQKVSGLTGALAGLLARGRAAQAVEALAPSDAYARVRKDSLDRALREAIDEAVVTIAKRFGAE